MIIPATTFQIIGFINEQTQTIEKNIQQGGKVFCYSDKGNPLVLNLTSNKKDITLAEMELFLTNKRDSVIKKKELDSVAGELEYIESFEIELDEAIEKFKEENPEHERAALVAFKKEFKNEKALEIVREINHIGPGSVIRVVIDLPNTGAVKKYTFKNNAYNLVRSRSIIFDQEGLPSTSGFYYYAQRKNIMPISIKPIFNKEKQSLNLFSVALSKLANMAHYNHIIEHMIRSINKAIKEEGKAYLPSVQYDYDKTKGTDAMPLVKAITDLQKKKEVGAEDADKFIEALNNLKDFVNANPRFRFIIQPSFNLLLTHAFMTAAKDDSKSPFSNLVKSFVNLNFSKENPDEKASKKAILSNYLAQLSKGDIPGEIICTYNTPSLKISEESDSWGFMPNNVQVDQMILSSVDSLILYKKLDAV